MPRMILALLIAAALLVAPTSAFAQDAMPPVACGDLSEEDCTFVTESKLAMLGLSSYAAVLDMEGSLTNLPNLPANIGWAITSDGQFVTNPETSTRLMELSANPPDDPMAMLPEVMDLMLSAYTDTSFDLVLGLALSDDLAALAGAQSGIPMPTELAVPLRMVEGVLYADVTDLGAAFGMPELTGWLGVDLATAMAANAEQAMKMLEESDAVMDPAVIEQMTANVQMNQAIQELTIDYVSVERLDDASLDGVDVAQFLYTFDVAGFVSSPEFIELLMQQISAQMEMQAAMGQPAPPISEADIQMVTDMLPMLAPMLLSGLNWQTVTSIGLDDMYVYQMESSIDWDLSTVTSMASAMASGRATRPAAGAESPYFAYDLIVNNGDFDAEFDIEAPEDAILIPLDQMQMQPMPVM